MPQTRSISKRIGAGQVHNDDKVPQRDGIVELPPGNGTAPPAKKRRVGRGDSGKKRRRENPGELCQLNLDVLFILADYIHPLDLLNLARTCKSLRRLLMDRSAAFVWKAVRRKFNGLPDCPDDLSEPAYTDLVFHPRCHGCGKYSSAIFWRIRRRYCPACRIERLFPPSRWPQPISRIILTTAEHMTVNKEHVSCHDKDQVALLMQEYELSSDKEQFLSDKMEQYNAIYQHAKQCESWQRQAASERKDELNVCRQERHESILERLKQLGYEREINYFGPKSFRESRKMPAKPLTDTEWARMLPKWLETMNYRQHLRLDAVVYQPRRQLLTSEYTNYTRSRSQSTPSFDLLPHVTDLARFPPFRDVIKAPEGTQMGEKPFASAFAQLPALIEEWKKELDDELASSIRIPPQLSSQDVSSCPNSITSSDKLRLACALFESGGHYCPLTHPEVFLISTPRQGCRPNEDLKPVGSIRDRFGIRFFEEAPYIVHACGLDPSVAKSDDMDRRNARLRCLACKGQIITVMNWREAMLHARVRHRALNLAPLSESLRWQLVDDEHIDSIQAVEESIKKESSFERCLLCQPRVGDASGHAHIVYHLLGCHEMGVHDIQRGTHYVPLGVGTGHGYWTCAEMVEEDGQVIFREPRYRGNSNVI